MNRNSDMGQEKPTVALIYDFDGTLSPANMQEFGFIQAFGKDPDKFWEKSGELSESQDASEILCYMKLMIDEAKAAGVALKREDFQKFGGMVQLYKGVKEWFGLINEYGEKKGVNIVHYINSSGLIEMIEGTSIYHEFRKVYACSFFYENGVAVWPGVAVDYTAKTQFLFKINKGVHSIRDHRLVNQYLPENQRPVPFSRMIYFGDGATDIPCMKLVKQFGGHSIAVYHPDMEDGETENCAEAEVGGAPQASDTRNPEPATHHTETGWGAPQASDIKSRMQQQDPNRHFPSKRALSERLLSEERVHFVCPADYTKNSRIYKVVTTIIDKIKADIDLNAIMG